MNIDTNCPRCGGKIPEGAPEGQCPRCLILLGLDDETLQGEQGEDAGLTGPEPIERVGPYRILGNLGEGGMGIVYLAEQEQPIRRRVAIKLIKRGMDTDQVIARFESERQALALMSHPNVAQVFEAGATEDGRPYFAMEYVRGIPITAYCDRYELSLPDRLRLFIQASEAIQHAHHKGIIHRDVKPSNVLVTSEDGEPKVKVIDFGIAKATHQRLTERSLFTEQGLFIGTPEYMSPEQADAGSLDVDTRTDVYSLGVLLYEIISGALPFDSTELRRAGYDEIRRRIREDSPPKPSTRLGGLGEASRVSAKSRGTDLSTLTRQLRGDLDWITMKALEKEPARRYASPSELAAEIRRYLSDEPVLAGPPSAGYRFRKLVRRHRVGVFAAVAVLTAVVVGGTVSGWQAVRATRAERVARQEAETALQVSNFLVDLFRVSDPGVAQGDDLTAKQILEKGREKIENELQSQPLVRARLLATIGEITSNLGLYDEALDLLEASYDTRRRQLGDDHLDTGRGLHLLGRAHADRGDDLAARESFEAAQTILEQHLGGESPEVADNLNDLAELAFRAGRYDEAEALYQRTLRIRRSVLGRDHDSVATSLDGLGIVHVRRGEHEQALELFQQALVIGEKNLGEFHPDIAISLSNLAATLGRLGRDDEAEPLLIRANKITEKVFGPEHRMVSTTLQNLGGLYGRLGRLEESEPVFRRAAEIQEGIFGPSHPKTAESYKNLGLTFMLKGSLAEAEEYLLRALAIDTEALGPEHYATVWSHNRLGGLYRRWARSNDAEGHYETALAAGRAGLGPEHPEVAASLRGLGQLAYEREDWDRAEELLRDALRIHATVLGKDNPDTAGTLVALADVLAATDRREEARAHYRRALDIRSNHLRPDHPTVALSLNRLGELSMDEGDEAEAERLFRQALAISEAAHGTDHLDVAEALFGLGRSLAAQGEVAEAGTHYAKALEIHRAGLDENHPTVVATLDAIAQLPR